MATPPQGFSGPDFIGLVDRVLGQEKIQGAGSTKPFVDNKASVVATARNATLQFLKANLEKKNGTYNEDLKPLLESYGLELVGGGDVKDLTWDSIKVRKKDGGAPGGAEIIWGELVKTSKETGDPFRVTLLKLNAILGKFRSDVLIPLEKVVPKNLFSCVSWVRDFQTDGQVLRDLVETAYGIANSNLEGASSAIRVAKSPVALGEFVEKTTDPDTGVTSTETSYKLGSLDSNSEVLKIEGSLEVIASAYLGDVYGQGPFSGLMLPRINPPESESGSSKSPYTYEFSTIDVSYNRLFLEKEVDVDGSYSIPILNFKVLGNKNEGRVQSSIRDAVSKIIEISAYLDSKIDIFSLGKETSDFYSFFSSSVEKLKSNGYDLNDTIYTIAASMRYADFIINSAVDSDAKIAEVKEKIRKILTEYDDLVVSLYGSKKDSNVSDIGYGLGIKMDELDNNLTHQVIITTTHPYIIFRLAPDQKISSSASDGLSEYQKNYVLGILLPIMAKKAQKNVLYNKKILSLDADGLSGNSLSVFSSRVPGTKDPFRNISEFVDKYKEDPIIGDLVRIYLMNNPGSGSMQTARRDGGSNSLMDRVLSSEKGIGWECLSLQDFLGEPGLFCGLKRFEGALSDFVNEMRLEDKNVLSSQDLAKYTENSNLLDKANENKALDRQRHLQKFFIDSRDEILSTAEGLSWAAARGTLVLSGGNNGVEPENDRQIGNALQFAERIADKARYSISLFWTKTAFKGLAYCNPMREKLDKRSKALSGRGFDVALNEPGKSLDSEINKFKKDIEEILESLRKLQMRVYLKTSLSFLVRNSFRSSVEEIMKQYNLFSEDNYSQELQLNRLRSIYYLLTFKIGRNDKGESVFGDAPTRIKDLTIKRNSGTYAGKVESWVHYAGWLISDLDYPDGMLTEKESVWSKNSDEGVGNSIFVDSYMENFFKYLVASGSNSWDFVTGVQMADTLFMGKQK